MAITKSFKLTELGPIPNEWSVNRLIDVTKDMIQGVNTAIDIPEYVSDGIPMLKANNVIDQTVIFKDCDYISEATFNRYSERYKLRKNDFLFSNIGARLGTGSLLKVDLECSFAWNVLRIIPNQAKIVPHYLAHTINSPKISQIIKSQQAGSGMGFVPKGTMQGILVPVPPKEEQEAIANALSEADAYIESLEKLIAKKCLIKTGVMQELLTGERRLNGFKSKWLSGKIGQLCDYQNGKALEKYFNSNDGQKVISIGNYTEDGTYSPSKCYINCEQFIEAKSFVLRKNDLALLLNDKTSVGTIIGRAILIDTDDNYVFNQRTMRLTPKRDIDCRFLWLAINTDYNHKKFVSLAKPGTQIYLNTSDVLNFVIKFPSDLSEQAEITDIIFSINNEIYLLEEKLNKARLIKQGMMQELLTGRIRLV